MIPRLAELVRRLTKRVEAIHRHASVNRRALAILGVVVALAAPAGVLRALCVGNACAAASGEAAIPFCSLPPGERAGISRGFNEQRSPDVLTIAGSTAVVSRGEDSRSAWPSLLDDTDDRVPIAFWGNGVQPGAEIPDGTGIDDIAPTAAGLIGLKRPHPNVRSGEAIEGVATDDDTRLLVQVVWRSVGSADLQAEPDAWPFLESAMDQGAGTLSAGTGSLPIDPAAVVTSLGTGGLPGQHGMVGEFVRNNQGRVVPAWGKGTPVSVIATLGDHLDELLDEEPKIALVGTRVADRGAIGGHWYPGSNDDTEVLDPGVSPRELTSTALRVLRNRGYGRDDIPDLLVVVAGGSIAELDASLRTLSAGVNRFTGERSSLVLTATGADPAPSQNQVSAGGVVRRLERSIPGGKGIVEAVTGGGFFLDQAVLADQKIANDDVVSSLALLKAPDGSKLFADVFPALAVSFERYC